MNYKFNHPKNPFPLGNSEEFSGSKSNIPLGGGQNLIIPLRVVRLWAVVSAVNPVWQGLSPISVINTEIFLEKFYRYWVRFFKNNSRRTDMPKPNYVSSISIKFESESISQLRKEATENQRSLSGEIRHRLNQTLQANNSDKNQSE